MPTTEGRLMPSISDDVRAIEEALAAGPTPGPWMYQGVEAWSLPDGAFAQWGRFSVSAGSLDERDDEYYFIGTISNVSDTRQNEANAALVTTCDPARLRRVLDTMQAMGEALRIGREFMAIARDWHIDEAEINGEMRSTYDWIEKLEAALVLYEGTK